MLKICRYFSSPFLIFSRRMTETTSPEKVYEKAEEYWASQASDLDGMLGGFEKLHIPDINDSKKFLAHLRKSKLLIGNEVAVDCGSGIGRVTKHLLLPAFKIVDMVDVTESFIENSAKYIGESNSRVGNKFVLGLQDFVPTEGRYDLIWIQWVSGHLTDEDFIQFFQRCIKGIKNQGCIVLKENVAAGNRDFDAIDNSWTRPETEILSLFERAGLNVVLNRKQHNFPQGMYEVRMFCLKPSKNSN